MNNNQYEHRKAKCRLSIKDKNGNPLKNTQIQIKQTAHEFLFGCGAFNFLALEAANNDAEKQRLTDITNKWLEVYNYGTLPFYWGNFEPEEGKPETEILKKTALNLQKHNITLKGHPLCWHTVCAPWLLKYDTNTILKKQLDRITRDVTAFKGLIDMWDVINEVVIMPNFDKYDNAVTRICKMLGRNELVKEVFAAAKEANPDGIFLINDFNTTVSYEILLDGLLNAGIPISTIGIQSHQHQGYWGKEKLEQVLNRFKQFNLPLHFTENTLVSGSLIPPEIEDLNDWQVKEWPSLPEFEERQKQQTEEMYRILFAEPLVKAVTGWDFTDGAWLNAPSGVLRKDGSAKPVYNMLKQLIKGEWWTDYSTQTDSNGEITIDGFKGTYSIISKCSSAELKLDGTIKSMTINL